MSALPVLARPDDEPPIVAPPPRLSLVRSLYQGVDPVHVFVANKKRPDPWQTLFVRDRSKRVMVLVHRQAGKSEAALMRAVYEIVFRAPAFVIIVSQSQRHAADLLLRLKRLCAPFDHLIRATVDSGLQYALENGSRVLSLAADPDTVRGYPAVNLLIIDEARIVSDELYYTLRPMLAVSGGTLLALTTPGGARGWFWHEFTKGGEVDQDTALTLKDHWHRYVADVFKCPRLSAKDLEEERTTMGEDFFAQEYLCRFLKSELAAGETPFTPATIDKAFVDTPRKPLLF